MIDEMTIPSSELLTNIDKRLSEILLKSIDLPFAGL